MKLKSLAIVHKARWARPATIAALAAVSLLLPRLGLPQPLTGPAVNALLILTVEMGGIAPALVVGMITPLSALTYGVLPLPLMVMIPFIALGNATLVMLYNARRSKGYWQAVGAAAVAKCVLLSAIVALLTYHPFNVVIGSAVQPLSLPPALVSMMQLPQLFTALAGGIIAWGIIATTQRR